MEVEIASMLKSREVSSCLTPPAPLRPTSRLQPFPSHKSTTTSYSCVSQNSLRSPNLSSSLLLSNEPLSMF
ncbi:UNVERIFIED_CONTAM: hypothetical protein GTU68_055653 [Idotea baltica]|nr:hypothetical protein [Idotea baltica]